MDPSDVRSSAAYILFYTAIDELNTLPPLGWVTGNTRQVFQLHIIGYFMAPLFIIHIDGFDLGSIVDVGGNDGSEAGMVYSILVICDAKILINLLIF